MQTITRNQDVFDAVVVGSGANGGLAAKELTEAGMKVAVLEAGAKVTPADYTEHVQPYELKSRGNSAYVRRSPKSPELLRERPIQGLLYACRESNYKWFVNDIDNPYATPKEKPFHWIRMRVLGGRSLSWGRQSYRTGDIDFKAASRDGYGDNWPISYQDLVPYYEKVERFIGFSGQEEGLDQLPDSVFLPAMEMTRGEKLWSERVRKKMGRVVTIGRVAILTKDHNGRAACHYCGPCEQGCITHSYYASPFTTLAAAANTGNLTLLTDAVASHVTMDRSTGRASGIAYIDRVTRAPREVRAKVVVLCASTIESTRLLLNSAPGGLANSSGVLGRYLMDHIYGGGASGDLPELTAKAWVGAPRRPNGIYIPRFRNIDRTVTDGMIRGYGYQGRTYPAFDFGASGFGADFKQAVHDNALWRTGIGVWAECLARYENRVTIDKDRTDAWGIPAVKIDMSWSDNELALWQNGREEGAEMLEASGHTNVRLTGKPSVPGFCIHEMGTARMGDDPKKSVLNGFNQAHDVKNLFVTDGAAWVSSACQNPTLTMMAITARACDYIVDQHKRGEFA